ncbi:MAG: KR domain-containing protein [Planctomycetaceae bacterium]|jgi:malonyl CoA-acyl carrier protein transacylase/NAD(P)-dependent dehydrogenase (short-subunit alcohol dehydrogenase family)|nr:KR domain-containing protein [Planctomycetaceae bacterium]
MIKSALNRISPARKIAFLFHGQGFPQEEMFSQLAAKNPSIAEKIAQIDAILQRLQLPTLIETDSENRLTDSANNLSSGKNGLRTQIALLAAAILTTSQLEEWGIVPDLVFGYSYGEYSALVASGAWSFETAAKATAKRYEVLAQINDSAATGAILTNAGETALRRLFDEINGELFVSHRNAPDQTIIAGKKDDLKKLKNRIEQNCKDGTLPVSTIAIFLPVSAALHSPLMKNVCPLLENALSECELQPPDSRRLFLSGATTRFTSDPDAIRENLVKQTIKPVDFMGMILKAYQTGCREFIEVGPKKVLINFAKKILADKNDVQFFACKENIVGKNIENNDSRRFLQQLSARRFGKNHRFAGVTTGTPPPACQDCAKSTREISKFSGLKKESARNCDWLISADDFCRLNRSENGKPPVVQPEDVASRFVLRMTQSPLTINVNTFQPQGYVLLIGENELAKTMQSRLSAMGIDAIAISAEKTNLETLSETLRSYWRQKPIGHVVCLTSYDEDTDARTEVSYQKRLRDAVLFPIEVCREIILIARDNKSVGRLTFLHAARFGGTYGLTGDVAVPDGGAIAGLFKALNDELRVRDKVYVPLRIVDHAENVLHDEIAEHLLAEMAADFQAVSERNFEDAETIFNQPPTSWGWNPYNLEIGYVNGERLATRSVPVTKTPRQNSAENSESALREISVGGTWILVGGLRGITGECAFGLAQKYRPKKVILVGSSPFQILPPELLDVNSPEVAAKKRATVSECVKTKRNFSKVWSQFTRDQEMSRNFKRFQELGCAAEYRACDMRKWRDVANLIALLETRGEKIAGVINGAMLNTADVAIDKAKRQEYQAGFDTKILGATALLELLSEHPLEFYAGFGSVSGRFGGNGQTGYTASNDYLVKLLSYYRGKFPQRRFVCFEWGAWSEVGISWRPDIRGIHLAAGTIFISPKEGTRHFVEEFERGLPELEPLFVAWKYYKRFQPDVIHAK